MAILRATNAPSVQIMRCSRLARSTGSQCHHAHSIAACLWRGVRNDNASNHAEARDNEDEKRHPVSGSNGCHLRADTMDASPTSASFCPTGLGASCFYLWPLGSLGSKTIAMYRLDGPFVGPYNICSVHTRDVENEPPEGRSFENESGMALVAGGLWLGSLRGVISDIVADRGLDSSCVIL